MKSLMTFIPDQRALTRWVKANLYVPCFRYPISHQKTSTAVLRERRVWFAEHGPKEYPCFVLSHCTSTNYEEFEPRYLYWNDVNDLRTTFIANPLKKEST